MLQVFKQFVVGLEGLELVILILEDEESSDRHIHYEYGTNQWHGWWKSAIGKLAEMILMFHEQRWMITL